MSSADVIEVDGSFGEGGGQILRTAVAFSVILGKPVRVDNIRAGREVPGLRQQHVSALQTLGSIFGAKLSGAEIGSSEVSFSPGRLGVTNVTLDMKTAASITLLLQAVIPAVALTHSGVTLEIIGGTDVPWSPSFDYLSTVVRPAYGLLGIEFEATASRRGYYPRGGGNVTARVEPAVSLKAVSLTRSIGPAKADLVSRCGRLPRHVAERQLEAMVRVLSASEVEVGSKLLGEEEADSPGSSVLASACGAGRLMGADELGAKGRSAEEVGEKAAESLVSSVKSGACVDSNLADMVAPMLSLAEGESSLLVPQVSLHLKTGLHVAKLFTGCDSSYTEEGRAYLVRIRPVSE
ncbi:MAG TPA: RNA 3'-terminal phosphate cyclase [Nitrososphaerales archaeon]|nr:RNA 3'-terminal phosphate cyclase [Nitrososphaerales archaeon]